MFSGPTYSSIAVSTSFGFHPTTTQTPLYGSTSSSFDFFGPSPSTSYFYPGTFGQDKNQPTFGSTQIGSRQPSSSGTFYNSASNTYGQQTKPTYGFTPPSCGDAFGAVPSSSSGGAFGAAPSSGGAYGTTSSSGGAFSQSQQIQQPPFPTPTCTNYFNSTSSFGTSSAVGTVIKYTPVFGTDIMQRSGISTNINTKLHSITCMKEYEKKSFEELRWEDYQANRKGSQQQTGFGATSFAPSTSSSFGQFGQTGAFGQNSRFGTGKQTTESGSFFGKLVSGFGTTTGQSTFNSNATAVASPFSSVNTSQPFVAPPKLLFDTPSFGSSAFGQHPTQETQPNVFGQPQTGAFGMPFGQAQQSQPGSFFQTLKPTAAFGSFGQTATTTTFTPPVGAFGQTSTFGSFAKPAQYAFGQPSQFGFGTSFGSQAGAPPFSNYQQKPGFFGNTISGGAFSNPAFQPFSGLIFQPQQQQPQQMFGNLQAENENQGQGLIDPFGYSNALTGLDYFSGRDKHFATREDVKALLDDSEKVVSFKPKLKLNAGGNMQMDVFAGAINTDQYNTSRGIKLHSRRLVIHKKFDSGKAIFDKGLFNVEYRAPQFPSTTSPETKKKLKSTSVSKDSSSKSRKDVKKVLKESNTENLPKVEFSKKGSLENVSELQIPKKSSPKKQQKAGFPKKSSLETVPDFEIPKKSSPKKLPKTGFPKKSSLKSVPELVPKKSNLENLSEVQVSKKSSPDSVSKLEVSKESSTKNMPKKGILKHVSSFGVPKKGSIENVLKLKVTEKPSRESLTEFDISEKSSAEKVPKLGVTEVSNSEGVSKCEVSEKNGTENIPKFKTGNRACELNNDNIEDKIESCIATDHAVSNTPATVTRTDYPCGVILTRPDYYTVPPLDELPKYVDENGACFVKGFTVGRYDYGNVYFPDEFDVSNLNLDEIIHFRPKAVTVYPDDSNKPPLGKGLNRRAQVTLDGVWPSSMDKSKVITDPTDLLQINFTNRLVQLSKKHNSTFKDYRPETGSWVFLVDHFSTYGLTESDEEEMSKDVKLLDRKEKGVKNKGKKDGEKEKTDKKEDEKKKEAKEDAEKEIKEGEKKKEIEKDEEMKEGEEKKQTEKDGEKIETKEYKEKKDKKVDAEKKEKSKEKEHDKDQEKKEKKEPKKQKETRDAQTGTDDEFEISLGPDYVPLERTPLRPSRQFIYRDFEKSHISLMKCSFFEDSSDVSDKETETQTDVSQPPIVQKNIKMSVPDEFLPKLRALNNPSCIVPNKRSLLLSYRNCMDTNIYHRHSFRTGWYRGNLILHPQMIFSTQFSSSFVLRECSWTDLSQERENPFLETMEEHLRIVQFCSRLSIESSEIPLFTVKQGTESLLKHQKLMHSVCGDIKFGKIYYYCNIWDLMATFWSTQDNQPCVKRELFSSWLKKVVSPQIEEVLDSDYNFDDINTELLKRIFDLLTGHRIEEAASLAMKLNMPQLSLLISQLSFNDLNSFFIQEQWTNWNYSNALKHFNKVVFRIYLLISGLIVHNDVNTCKYLDWKRALGIHLWYVIPNGAPLTLALNLYKTGFEKLNYAPRPDPPHEGINPTENYDILYHLITLYAEPHSSLDRVLDPITHTDDPTDFRLSWLLLQTFEALEIGKISNSVKNYLHINFAAQLENIGYWPWAIFVLLYLKEHTTKKLYVMQILERNLSADLTPEALEEEGLLVNSFGIPAEWIHVIKAKKAEEDGKNWEVFRHLTLSKSWCDCYNFALLKIIPNLVTFHEFNLLEKVLQIMGSGEKFILDWKVGGGLLLDFLRLWNILYDKEYGDIPKTLLKVIENDFESILIRLGQFPFKTHKQALCISECSKCIAYLMKKFYLQLHDKSFISISKACLNVELLVMPPDYKQNELLKAFFGMLQIQAL